jgi:hypothetical protein
VSSLQALLSFSRALIASFAFGAAATKLYRFCYCDDEPIDDGLARSFLILLPALTAVFWLIKLSLLISIGLLGSLSFVRFRAAIRRVEDAAFMLMAIAVAISTALEAYAIPVLLLASFFILNTGTRWLRGQARQRSRYAVVTFQSQKVSSLEGVLQSLESGNLAPQLLSARSFDGSHSFVFSVTHTDPQVIDRLKDALAALDRDAQFHVFYPNSRLGA